jgi:hypothetical protein
MGAARKFLAVIPRYSDYLEGFRVKWRNSLSHHADRSKFLKALACNKLSRSVSLKRSDRLHAQREPEENAEVRAASMKLLRLIKRSNQ